VESISKKIDWGCLDTRRFALFAAANNAVGDIENIDLNLCHDLGSEIEAPSQLQGAVDR
jgi:hypothetical protein